MTQRKRIVGLAGGVGGAKFLHGLDALSDRFECTAIVNTADDFELYGLRISPDVDTVMYTLGGIANPQTGWGIAGDTRATLDGIAQYGEDPWFLLGDRDFSTHILRTQWLREGQSLTEVTTRLATALGIHTRILPMSNEDVRSEIQTADGWLGFQEYFVGRRHADDVIGVRFTGIERAAPAPGVTDSLANADAVILCPSNPVVSIGPILSVAGIGSALRASDAPVVAISPIIQGSALKGPAAGMLESAGYAATALGVAERYRGLVDVMVIDERDRDLAPAIEDLGMRALVLQTIMGDRDDRTRLATDILDALPL